MNEYRDGIRLAWQGEQWGRAFFEQLADAATDADQRAKWQVLADLEEATGDCLAPLVVDTPTSATPAGYGTPGEVAANYVQLSWETAIAQMLTIVDPAIERFQSLLDMAPAQDRDTVQILVDHEVAIREFAERERAGDSKNSLDTVRAVIARARAK